MMVVMMMITMRVDFDASWRAGYETCMRMMITWCWRWTRCPRGETRSDTLVKVAPPGPRQWAIVPTWDAVSCVSAKILHDKPKTGHLNTTIKSPSLSSHMLLLISECFILEAYHLCPIVLQKKLLASEFCQVHQLKHLKLFVSSRWTNNILYGAAGALHALHWTIFLAWWLDPKKLRRR